MSIPYFPMFPDDFEADTAHLTMIEDGAYNRLLRLCWRSPGCTIPADLGWVMRKMRARSVEEQAAVSVVLDEFFQVQDGRYINARLMREWGAAHDAHERRKNAGAAGGKTKSLKTNDSVSSNATPMLKQPEPEPEPLDLDKSKSSSFSDFWSQVPCKIGREAASKAFKKLSADDREMASVRAKHFYAKWREANPQASWLHPSTYLNGKRWEDYPPEQKAKADPELLQKMLNSPSPAVRAAAQKMMENAE